jgi:hypothetical protein
MSNERLHGHMFSGEKMKNAIAMSLVSLSCVLVLGCGDDSSTKSHVDAGANKDAGSDKNDGGRPSDAGATVDGSTPVICGGALCRPAFTPACCTAAGTGEVGHKLEFAGREAGKCGTDIGEFAPQLVGICLQINQPGELDPACPAVANPTAGQAPLKGCCTDQGFCGSFEPGLPLGCEYQSGKRGKPCGDDVDAGSEDAGR